MNSLVIEKYEIMKKIYNEYKYRNKVRRKEEKLWEELGKQLATQQILRNKDYFTSRWSKGTN